MILRELPPFSLLCYSEKVSLGTMMKHVRVKARDLYAVSHTAGLEVTGPLYWIYHGADGNPETLFLLDIGIPVNTSGTVIADYSVKRMEPFRCASVIHEGSWAEFPRVYGKLLSDIRDAGLKLSGENRELYLNMDFADENNHITEIQIGIIKP